MGNIEAHCCFIGRGGLWFGSLLDTSKESFKSNIKRPGRSDVSWSQHMTIKTLLDYHENIVD